ncbi:dipeptidyl aminopeptidase [Rhodofomes roseus]|uniref:Dipeptidyl aminopeptidase n=1 Tax=Rhodofomes roseus TaxID=34475 RepID=A0ABQ8K5X9_9APHY|nr:dipeptidyl aminopeptidase [Rhodofomes roseus]KAH9832495.1 dipeptidyl aminopeptidase [Rhodofomes roseus]
MHVGNYDAEPQEGTDSDTLLNDATSTTRLEDIDEPGYAAVKPIAYYGEGPFDPPSSDDEEDELEKPSRSPRLSQRGPRDLEDGVLGSRKHASSLRFLVIALVSLLAVAGVIGIFAAHSYTGMPYRIRGTKHITMDHIFNGTFYPTSENILWVPEAGDGVFATQKNDYLTLVDLKSNSTRNLVAFADLTDEYGRPLSHSSWKLSADMRYMLIKADRVKLWRHSSYGNYYVHDLESKHTWPLVPPTYPPVTSYAVWSPTGQSIAYVLKNDLYVLPSASPDVSPVRVTSNGNASMFNGIPDWVYEEEVFSADYALWWSPDSKNIAYLSFDETAVDEYTFPIYNPTEDSHAVVPYPQHVTMKYPKPGYKNPIVSLQVFQVDDYLRDTRYGGYQPAALASSSLQLDWDGRQSADDSVIQEIAWVGNETLLVREVNRAGNNGTVSIFDLGSTAALRSHGHVVRRLGKDGEQGDDGWIDQAQRVYPLPASLSPPGHSSYLDVIPTPEGYNHIALFSPADTSTPRFLTSGEWEVTSGILAVDVKKSLVYFQAANPDSLQRHIYSVPIPAISTSETVKPTALTDVSSAAVYNANFSPEGGFYLLTYKGPYSPWQKVIKNGDKGGVQYVLTENPQLNKTLEEYEMPVVSYGTITSEGYELNFREIRPPRMDDTGRTKYPVLFRLYNGPNSQMVNHEYGHDWHDFLACSMEYIIVTVDGRGTGYKGRRLRNPVKDNLGHFETIDQINAAKIWAGKNYVDSRRIGIWGWSYGGFMSSKVIEANAGVHTLAMAVAPVTSWRLYDSIYTERYMDLPNVNPQGYITASISNVTGFHNADFLLAHGSGDDNVHFANSAHLLDMLTQEHVRNFEFRMFTDSDHSMYKRDANRELYEFMTRFLFERWGKGGKRRSW